MTGATGATLVGILWGTAGGLALAHWFAFRVAAPTFRGESVTNLDTRIGLAQAGGAMFVAAISSLPVLLLSSVRAQETTGGVPAVVVGGVSYLIARRAGMRRPSSLSYGLTALALGVLVALVKSKLASH